MLEFRVCSAILLEMPTPFSANPQFWGWSAVGLRHLRRACLASSLYGGAK